MLLYSPGASGSFFWSDFRPKGFLLPMLCGVSSCRLVKFLRSSSIHPLLFAGPITPFFCQWFSSNFFLDTSPAASSATQLPKCFLVLLFSEFLLVFCAPCVKLHSVLPVQFCTDCSSLNFPCSVLLRVFSASRLLFPFSLSSFFLHLIHSHHLSFNTRTGHALLEFLSGLSFFAYYTFTFFCNSNSLFHSCCFVHYLSNHIQTTLFPHSLYQCSNSCSTTPLLRVS